MAAETGKDQQSFDYVIIGGGTSGLVVAARLSEDPDVSVLVVEAGGDHSKDPNVTTPGLMGAQYGKKEYDWNFASVPQPTLNNRTINQARGRQLGGSSAFNFLLMVYPSKANIDAWESVGNEGWNFDSLSPYFRKFARTNPPTTTARKNARMDKWFDNKISEQESGPLNLSFGDGLGQNNSAWMDTFDKLGLNAGMDPRSGTAVGAFQQASTIDPKTKQRTSALSYLTQEVRGRKNLSLMTNTVVKNIIFDKQGDDFVAKGVHVYSRDGTEKTILATEELILAAGALQSPQILELSGIGDRKILEKFNIPVLVDNPGVGEHMQDHAILCQSFEVEDGVTSGDVTRDPAVVKAAVEAYQQQRAGPLGQDVISCAYVPMADHNGPIAPEERKKLFDQYPSTQGKGACPPNERQIIREVLTQTNQPCLQHLLFPTQLVIPQNPKSMADYITPQRPENYLTVMTILNQPFSRGSVHIESADFQTKPVWDPRYNAEPIDMEILARGAQFVEKLVATPPFADLFKKGGQAMQARADDLEKGREVVRSRQISVFHVSSSTAMLPRERGGVVDTRLRVYGTKGLRVVDAGVFPLEPQGNIQATVYAVAERAADLLKEDRKKRLAAH